MNIGKLLSYLFDTYAGSPNWLFWRWTMIGAGLMIIIGLASLRFKRKGDNFDQKLWRRLGLWAWVGGLIIYALASFRIQNIYWLSMRIWIFAWLVFVAIWLARILWWRFRLVPKARLQRQANQKYQSYLPNKK